MIYQKFAKFYDELFDENMYKQWFDFVTNNVDTSSTMLDMACGTGRLISLLQKAGYNMSGMDLSDDMLTLADERLNHNTADNNFVALIQADMTNMEDLPIYDVISCFDDSLCYLPDEQTLLTVFKNVYQHLTGHGKFMFDVITPYQTDVVYPGYMYNYHDDKHAFMWQSYLGDYDHSVEHDLAFFTYNPSIDAYEEFNEIHKERTYELNQYLKLLQVAGFKDVRVTANFGRNDVDEQTTRWFFICNKE